MEYMYTKYEVQVSFLFFGSQDKYEELEGKLSESHESKVYDVFIKPDDQFNGAMFCRGTFWPFDDINKAESFAALIRFILSTDSEVKQAQTHSIIMKVNCD